jgi:hypothetical protein
MAGERGSHAARAIASETLTPCKCNSDMQIALRYPRQAKKASCRRRGIIQNDE